MNKSDFQINNKQLIRFFILFIFLVALLISSYIFNSEAIILVFVTIISFMIVASKSLTMSFCFFIATLPFSDIILINGRTFNVFIIISFMLFIKIIYHLICYKKELNPLLFFGIIIFAVYACLGIRDFKSAGISFVIVIADACLVLIAIANLDKIEVKTVIKVFLFSLILELLIGLLADDIPALKAIIRENNFIENDIIKSRFVGLTYDSNFLALQCICGISLAIYMATTHHSKETICYVLLALLFVIFGVLTLSKMFFVGVLVIGCWWLITSNCKIKYKLMILGIAIVGGIILLALLPRDSSFRLMLDRLLLSLQKGNLSDFTTGRSTLWLQYLSLWCSDWKTFLFGAGVDFKLPPGIIYGPHNYYIEMIYSYGLIGATLFFALLAKAISLCKNRVAFKPNKFQYISLIAVMVCFFALGLMTHTMSLWLMAISCLLLGDKNERQNQYNYTNL